MYKHVILFFFYWSFSIDVRISFITKGRKRRSNQKKENKQKTKERGANSSQKPFFVLVPIYCWLKFHLLSLFPGIGQGVLMKQIMTAKGARIEEKVWTFLWLYSIFCMMRRSCAYIQFSFVYMILFCVSKSFSLLLDHG